MTHTSDFTVLQLLPSDAVRVQGLLDVFSEAFDDPGTYDRARPGPDYLRRLLGSETFIALVALQGDDPAVALYTQLGVREDVMHFDLPVEGT